MSSVVPGLLVVVAGGVLSGLFTAPMRYVRDWPWEAVWFVYCTYAYVSFPALMVFCIILSKCIVRRDEISVFAVAGDS